MYQASSRTTSPIPSSRVIWMKTVLLRWWWLIWVVGKIVATVKTQIKEKVAEDGVADPDACGSCYGAYPTEEKKCCQTCDDVRKGYALKEWTIENYDHIEQCRREGYSELLQFKTHEGCIIYGDVSVNKVQGNFHFAPGTSMQSGNMHVHDIRSIGSHLSEMDFSHSINQLTFGDIYKGFIY